MWNVDCFMKFERAKKVLKLVIYETEILATTAVKAKPVLKNKSRVFTEEQDSFQTDLSVSSCKKYNL